MQTLSILSIDGGGLRGIVPLTVIRHIENTYEKPIHELFDVIAGTSTGGLLTCALLIEDGKSDVGGQRKFTLDQIEDIYNKKGKFIFPPASKLTKWIYWLYRKFWPRYSKKNIEAVLDEYLSGKYILDCMKPIFITSFDVHQNRPVYFTSRRAIEMDRNILLTDVCRATSAAPTYFPSHKVSYGSDDMYCIDGGIVMNNPSFGVLFEVLTNPSYKFYSISDGISVQNIKLLSIGTGKSNKVINGKKTTGWGEVQWAKPAIDISLTGTSNVVHEQVKMIYDSNDSGRNYLRLNIKIDEKYDEMSDSRPETMTYLKDKVNEQIVNNKVANILIDDFFNQHTM